MKLKNNQSGVAYLAAILVVVVIVAVGFVGWKVWDNSRDNKKSNGLASSNTPDTKETDTTSKKQTTDNNTKATEATYFVIEELGVKFELPSSLKGLYYHIGNNGRTAYFSLDELKNTDCAADKTAQIALTRYSDADYSEDAQAAANKDYAKKIGDHYFDIASGQAMCGDESSAAQAEASAMKEELVRILPSTLQSE